LLHVVLARQYATVSQASFTAATTVGHIRRHSPLTRCCSWTARKSQSHELCSALSLYRKNFTKHNKSHFWTWLPFYSESKRAQYR